MDVVHSHRLIHSPLTKEQGRHDNEADACDGGGYHSVSVEPYTSRWPNRPERYLLYNEILRTWQNSAHWPRTSA